jgi:hypothetical protein
MGPKLKSKQDETFKALPNYKDNLDPLSRRRYNQKLASCGGIDPYALLPSVMSCDPLNYPDLKFSNVLEYFKNSKCHESGSTINAQRGMDAFELLVVGYSSEAYSYYVEPSKTYILRSEVNK